jgi:RNA polymerase sigma factor (sigma-70 family)
MDEATRCRWIAAHILPWEGELRGWLRQRLGQLVGCEADDIVQEAYARIWAADLGPVHNGRAYLYATVRHLLSEYLRRSRIVPIELLGEIESLDLISEEPGPDRRVAARQELERLQLIVAQLPARCRRAFELRKFEGLSHREVAQRMGLSEKTVENHLTRALAWIAAAWSDGGRASGGARTDAAGPLDCSDQTVVTAATRATVAPLRLAKQRVEAARAEHERDR